MPVALNAYFLQSSVSAAQNKVTLKRLRNYDANNKTKHHISAFIATCIGTYMNWSLLPSSEEHHFTKSV